MFISTIYGIVRLGQEPYSQEGLCMEVANDDGILSLCGTCCTKCSVFILKHGLDLLRTTRVIKYIIHLDRGRQYLPPTTKILIK
jgi:hypothetical protein